MGFLFPRLIRILFLAWCTSGTTRPQLRSSRPWLCPSQCPVPAAWTSSSARSTLTSLWRTVQNMSAWQSTTGERSNWKMSTLWQISSFNSYFSTIFRLHEFDEQVSAVREGMARIVPVPLLSLFTGYELETMVSIAWHHLSGWSGLFDNFPFLRFAEVQTSLSTCWNRWRLTRGWSQHHHSSSGFGRSWNLSPTRRGRFFWGLSGVALASPAPLLTSVGGILLYR